MDNCVAGGQVGDCFFVRAIALHLLLNVGIHHRLLFGLGTFFIGRIKGLVGAAVVQIFDAALIYLGNRVGVVSLDGTQFFEPGLDVRVEQAIGIFVLALLEQVLAQQSGAFSGTKFLGIRPKQLITQFQLLLVLIDQREFHHPVRIIGVCVNGSF